MKIKKYITNQIYIQGNGLLIRRVYVRLPLIINGEYVSSQGPKKSFSYLKRKTYKAAIALATQYRDAYLTQHNRMDLLRIKCRKKLIIQKSQFNTSGAIGICIHTHTGNGKSNFSYRARWCIEGSKKIKSESFAWKKYGKEQAFELACERRYQHTGTVIITDEKIIPCYPLVPYLLQSAA